MKDKSVNRAWSDCTGQDEGYAHSPEVIGDRWRQSEQHNQARQKREGQVT